MKYFQFEDSGFIISSVKGKTAPDFVNQFECDKEVIGMIKDGDNIYECDIDEDGRRIWVDDIPQKGDLFLTL